MSETGYTRDTLDAITYERCNGCGKPRSEWGPVCPGMNQGDWTHYHSPEFWIRRNEGSWGKPYEESIIRLREAKQ
jgi:hypothetical protein